MRKRKLPPKTISLNVLLDQSTNDMLEQLVETTGQTKAVLVRAGIIARYTHSVGNHPTCAHGQSCFVPQMFRPSMPDAPHRAPGMLMP